jgi:hypothetical protein
MDIGEMEYECVGWIVIWYVTGIRVLEDRHGNLKVFLKRRVVSWPHTHKLLLAYPLRVSYWRLYKQHSPPYAIDYVKLFHIQLLISLYETRDLVNPKYNTTMKPNFSCCNWIKTHEKLNYFIYQL